MFPFRWLTGFFRKKKLPVDISAVESVLGYHFADPNILLRSLKHRSYSQVIDGDTDKSNERLEFLGDSVLNMVVSHHLYVQHPDFQEGDLTKLKSALVSKHSIAITGRRMGIERFLLLSDSEEGTGGRGRTSIIADTYEALIGAIYIDGGFQAASNFIHGSLLSNSKTVLSELEKNHKSMLLEMTQSRKFGHPQYRTVSADGPDHDKMFTVEVFVLNESYGKGKGKSKKTAQQMAAKAAVEKFRRKHLNTHDD